MVEGSTQRNMTIDLHVKLLSMKVAEHTPVSIIWQRGNLTFIQCFRQQKSKD